MADPFSIVIGSVAVAEVCLKLGRQISLLQREVGGIEEELDDLMRDIDGLKDLCDTVEAVFNKRSSNELSESKDDTQITKLWAHLGTSLDNCHGVVTQLHGIFNSIQGQSTIAYPSKIHTIGKALRKRLREKDLRDCRAQMATYQHALQIVLAAITRHDIGISHDYNAQSFKTLSQDSRNLHQSIQSQITNLQQSIKLRDDSHYDAAAVSALKDLQESVNFAALAIKSVSGNHHFDVPQSVSSIFTGRDDLLQELRQIFIPRQDLGRERRQRRFVVHGLGGSGKTQFCCKFAEDNRESFWGVFWIDASTSERVKHTLGAIAKTAGLEQNEKSALHWLSNLEQNWLLIIDNADDDNIPLEKYFPKGNRGNVLVTTRNPAYRMHGNVGRRWYEFRGLELDEATQLLLKASDSPAPWDEVCTSLALKITEALGALALAIVHAGTAIRENLCSLKNYLDYYSRSWRKIRNATLTEKSTASDAVVYSTWEICYNRLEQKGTEAALDALELLNMMAFFHWETIPREIFSRALRNSEQESKPNIEVSAQPPIHSSWLAALFDRLREAPTALLTLLFRNQGPGILPKLIREAWQCGGVDNADDRIRLALKELVQMSLIIRNDHTDTYAMHPIVHRWARERPKMRLAEQALWAEVTGRVLAASVLLPPLGTAAADEKYHISLLSHVMHVQDCRRSTTEAISNGRRSTNQVFSWIISLVPDLAPDADKVRMYAKFSLIYAKCGYWKEAEELLKEVTGFLCRYLGPQHKRSRQALLFLSTVYWHLGRPSDAAMIQSSVLQTCVSHLGRSHPDTLRAMAELGRTRWQQGQYTVARDLQEEVLRELLLRLPHDSADVLEAKNNLGLTILKFWKRHHFEQAVRLHSEAAEGMAKVHGPDHEQTLAAKEHLCRAAVLLGGDHLESVEDLMTEVLETRRAKLGKEHPYTLLAMVNMAIVLTAMGQYKKAEDLVLEGLPVADRTLGRDHIGTLFGRQTHAAILLERREYAAAEEILLQVAESQKHMASHRGDYHPDRLGALIELARCSFALGKIDRAVAICDEAIYGLDSISMEEHPLAISLRVSRSRMLELSQSSLIDHRPEQHSHAIFPFIFFQPRNDTTDF